MVNRSDQSLHCLPFARSHTEENVDAAEETFVIGSCDSMIYDATLM